MNLGQMRTELLARGFDYLPATRANQFLLDAYHELCESDLEQGGSWPWLQATVSGAAPYTFTDLRYVLSVVDSTTGIDLVPVDRAQLLEEQDTDLTTTGIPLYWYMEGEVLKVFPVTADTLSIRYVQVPTDLSNDSDTPVVPARYHSLIIDGAVIKAYEDSDNPESAAAVRATLDRRLLRMADALLFRHDRVATTVARVGYHEDE